MTMESTTIICRCEDVTEDEVRAAIREGLTSLDEVKRILRCGMGHCQGRTCGRLIARLIAEETGLPMSEQDWTTFRPPTRPVPLGVLAELGGGDTHA
jgi:bacterioferritin-associated ferredoxin